MVDIDYKKVFSKLSHIKALSHDQKFEQIVQNIINYTLYQTLGQFPKNENDLAKKIKEVFGISIRPNVVLSNMDRLIAVGDLFRDKATREIKLEQTTLNKLKSRIEIANSLEQRVKEKWYDEIRELLKLSSTDNLEQYWDSLKTYLCGVFEQHGIQTLYLLNPNAKINEDDQKSLITIVESVLKGNKTGLTKENLTATINQFIVNANEERVAYISQLADATFTSFALTSDEETVNFLNKRYNELRLFLDTNFIFGILDLHKNSEDSSAKEILAEIKKNKLPFKLTYHPETLLEFKRVFDNKALYVKATKWSKESSKIALIIDELSPIEELFHKQNVEEEIDPLVFLDKYDHVDLILKDLGLTDYVPMRAKDDELADMEIDVEEYQKFYDSTPNRKPKSYLNFKHDVVTLREVRALNPKKNKFLDSKALFISSDYVLGKFEKKYYKKNWEINYVVSPSVFLQLVRPFIENDYSSNKRFIDTFSIPELRSFEIDYSTTRSKALQILNDSYHDTSFETKVKILRDQVILEKLEKLNDDFENQTILIENYIANENKILSEQKNQAEANIKEIKKEKEKVEEAKGKAEQEKREVEKEKSEAIEIIKQKEGEIEDSKQNLLQEKLKHNKELIAQKIDSTKKLYKTICEDILKAEKIRQSVDTEVDESYKTRLFYLSLVPLSGLFLIIFLIVKYSWNTMEPFTYIFAPVYFTFNYIFMAIKGSDFSTKGFFEWQKKKVENKVKMKYHFDSEELEAKRILSKKYHDEIKGSELELESLNS
jgi:hypothetical protein